MGAEFSEGRNAVCRGGLHWRQKVRDAHYHELSPHAKRVCDMLGHNIYVGKDATVMTLDDIKLEVGCSDAKRRRCSIWERGRAELTNLGLLDVSETDPYTFRVVARMPETTGTSHVLGTSHVPNGTSHVPVGTSHVPNGTSHVPVYKEVERESNTESESISAQADTAVDIYPAVAWRGHHTTIRRYFGMAAESRKAEAKCTMAEAADWVLDRLRSHIEASDEPERFFPKPATFFGEWVCNPPARRKTQDAEGGGLAERLVRIASALEGEA